MKCSSIWWWKCASVQAEITSYTYNNITYLTIYQNMKKFYVRHMWLSLWQPALMCFCISPVCVGSNLHDLWLGPQKECVQIGHIEEKILHVDGRGRAFPWPKHTAALDQNNLLLRHKVHISQFRYKHNSFRHINTVVKKQIFCFKWYKTLTTHIID